MSVARVRVRKDEGRLNVHRLQLVARQERGDDLLGAELLLSMREPGGNHGTGRLSEILVSSI